MVCQVVQGSRVGWGEAEGLTTVGDEAQISSIFSVIKLPAPWMNCGIFVGEHKFLDQGTVLLHGGEDEAGENIIPFCASVESSRATEPTLWLPGVGFLFSGGFLLPWSLLQSLGLFLEPGNLPGLPFWKLNNLSLSFTSSLQYNPGLWNSYFVKPRQAWNRTWYRGKVIETMVYIQC